MSLTKEQKRANEDYFRNILSLIVENGVYTYPNIGEVYTVRGGVFYGTKRGVREMQKITPKDFHKNIKLKGKEND